MPDQSLPRHSEPPVECPNGICDRLQIAQWDVQTLQTEREAAILSATMALRETMGRAYECLTRIDTLGPDVTETAVEAARMLLAGGIVETSDGF